MERDTGVPLTVGSAVVERIRRRVGLNFDSLVLLEVLVPCLANVHVFPELLPSVTAVEVPFSELLVPALRSS